MNSIFEVYVKKILMVSALFCTIYAHGMDCNRFNTFNWPKKITRLLVKHCKKFNRQVHQSNEAMQNIERYNRIIQSNSEKIQQFIDGKR